jgi:NADPH-dependent curcumin reductase CurA
MSKARVDSGLLGEIIELNNALYPVGKTVEGLLGWQTHACTSRSNLGGCSPRLFR